MKKVCAILPAHNEEKNIAAIISGAQKNSADVIVIDDGSTDNTYQLAQGCGAVVLRHNSKKGKGASLKDGLSYALSKDYDYIITIDADGQHSPDEIPLFLAAADKNEKTGIVIGNRLNRPEDMPFVRVCTNKFMSYLISSICKQSIADTQCGYKLIKSQVLKAITINTNKFEVESEILIKAARAHFLIASVPIKSIYAGEKSRINPFLDTLRFIRFLIKTIIRK